MKTVFMGTPEFASNILANLIEFFKIDVCYTQAPKPAKRGFSLQKSPVNLIAEQNNIPVRTPRSFKSEEEIAFLQNLKPDIILVVAYGMLLPKAVLDVAKYGCFNVHPSLLPRWRGASPIEHAIIYNDSKTACQIIKMQESLDTGDIVFSKEIKLDKTQTYKTLSKTLSDIGAQLLTNLLMDIKNGKKLNYTKQSETGITYAKKITNLDYLIDFSQPPSLVEAKIRALGGCFFIHNNTRIKILKANFDDEFNHRIKAGQILNNQLHLAFSNKGILKPILVQKEGGKILPIKDFLNGFKV